MDEKEEEEGACKRGKKHKHETTIRSRRTKGLKYHIRQIHYI